MKRILVLALFAAALMLPNLARAQQPPFIQLGGGIHGAPACAGALQYGGNGWCFDNPLNTTHNIYYWNGTAWTVLTNGSSSFASPLQLNGTSSGDILISSGATPTAYTLTLKATVPAQGDLLDFSNGTGQVASLADVATGSVLVSGGVATVPAYSATPSVTSVTATGSVDKTLNVSNGGHISNPIGTGVAPTTGTGTVVTGGTDTAMRVTGGTSPVTVTFGTAFAVAPVCVCSNGTTAADGCKTSSEGTGSVVVTTAGTDTFSLICVGK